MNKTIILFDIDGTLTEPRKKATQQVLDKLLELRKYTLVGIISGSDYSKLDEQMYYQSSKYADYIFAENGLVVYKYNKQIYSQNIAQKIGEIELKKLINFCLVEIANIDIPIKRGTFIEYRTGMINISPIGRNCTYEERLQFNEYDLKYKIRDKLCEKIISKFGYLDLQCSIGGQISIDIFPIGWDKSYCLKHLQDKFENIIFFGDKTHKGGNDYELYINPNVKSHHVNNYNETLKYLDNYINEYNNK